MSEPTVVVVEGTDDEGQAAGGAEFAAGVAAATSVQAAEEAEEAVIVAETAQGTADVALSVADSAEMNAWDAKAGVDELRGEMLAMFDEIRSALTPVVVEETTEEAAPEHPAPEPAAPQDTTTKRHGDETGKRYGAKAWFG